MLKKKLSKTGILTLISLILFMPFVLAYINVNDNGNSVMTNSTGIFSGGQKAFSRTADVVVARSPNVITDIYYPFIYDAVCYSTYFECSTTINSVSNNNTRILLLKGHYPIGLPLKVWNNFKLSGEGKDLVFLDKNATYSGGNADVIRLDAVSPFYKNIEISDLTINSTSDNSTTGVGINIPTADNLKIHDVDLTGQKGYGIAIGCPTGNMYKNNTQVYNIHLYDLNSSNDAFGGGCLQDCNIHDIFIERDGNKGSGSGLDLTNRDGCSFSNIKINIKNPVSGSWGFSGDFNQTNENWNNIIINGADYGIYIGKDSRNIVASNININATRRNGILFDGLGGKTNIQNVLLSNVLINNWATSGNDYAIYMKNTSFIKMNNVNAIMYTTSLGIKFETAENTTITNSMIRSSSGDIVFNPKPSAYFIDYYTYTYLPTCAFQNILDGKTIVYNNSASTYAQAYCVGGTGWRFTNLTTY